MTRAEVLQAFSVIVGHAPQNEDVVTYYMLTCESISDFRHEYWIAPPTDVMAKLVKHRPLQ